MPDAPSPADEPKTRVTRARRARVRRGARSLYGRLAGARWPARLLNVGLALLAALFLYALLGYELAPRLLRTQAIRYVRAAYGRDLTIGPVFIDPFALHLEIRALALPDEDGRTMLGFERAFVDLEALRSIWERSYVFRKIRIDRPRVRAVVRQGGALNLAELAGTTPPEAPPAPSGPLTPLRIDALTVSGGRLDFLDRTRAPEFTQRLDPVSFHLTRFRTTAEGGRFALEATGAQDAHFRWNGDFALTPGLRAAGNLAVTHFPLTVLADYLGDALPIAVRAGFAELEGTYDVRLTPAPQITLRVPRAAVKGLALLGHDPERTPIDVAGIRVHDARALLHERRVEIGRLAIDAPTTRVVRARDGTLNLSAALAKAAPAPSAAAADRGPAWSIALATLALTDATLIAEDRTVAPPATFRIAPLALELSDLSLDPTREIALSLRANIDGDTQLSVGGKLTPSPLSAQVDIDVPRAHLALAQPYVQQRAALRIADGTLAVRATLRLAPGGEGPKLDVAGDATLRDVQTREVPTDQELLSCARVDLRGLSYGSSPALFRIASVALHEPYARLVLTRQQTLNLARIFRGPAAPSTSLTKHAPLPASVARTESEPATPPLALRIDDVAIDGMRLSFTDQYVKPNFAAELRALQGTLRALSSDPTERATVSLTGRLGVSAPVLIAGTLQPFAYDKSTDVRIAWRNVTLPLFNPYSGRLTGYNITKGELTTDLRYRLRNRRLDAQHKIRVDQLTWGEATADKQQASLPVKLATALLRDRRGVIALDLPVQGKLDDPQFRMGPIVWKAVKNVVVKAATAPFALLGSLFSGAERARFVYFAPGDASLDESARAELAALAKALAERPELTLDVPIGAIAALDRPALEERKYQQTRRAYMARTLRGGAKHAHFDALDLGDQQDVLEGLVKQLLGKLPALPEPPPPPEGAGFRMRRTLRRQFYVQTLARIARDALRVDEGALEQLAQQRAEAVEQALTQGGALPATRVLLSREGTVSADRSKVRFELAVR